MAVGGRWRVMVVDDDVPLLTSLVEILGKEFEAVGASNGLDALEKLDRYEPDVIILDVSMPGVDGIDTCRAIRRHARFRAAPVVFLSGQDKSAYSDRAEGLDDVYFLRKPVEPAQLLERCRSLIRRVEEHTPPRKRYSITELATPRPDLDEGETARSPVVPTEVAGTEKPLAPADSEPVQPCETPAVARIMIIDDDSDVISFMLAVLHEQFEIFGVRDPISAIYKIIRYQPDLIMLDIAMPRLSGYQLSQLLRLNRNLRAIKILFVSSKDSPQEIAYAKKLGGVDYLVKPFDGEQLLRKVNAIVDAPDFIVREKALSFEEIRRAEVGDTSPSQFA